MPGMIMIMPTPKIFSDLKQLSGKKGAWHFLALAAGATLNLLGWLHWAGTLAGWLHGEGHVAS